MTKHESQGFFESDRSFAIFSYEVSHSYVLLRSMVFKTTAPNTRIDLAFFSPKLISIRTHFTGIRIEEVDMEELKNNPLNHEQVMEKGLRAYRFTGQDWTGFILAGAFYVHEDEFGFSDNSLIAMPAYWEPIDATEEQIQYHRTWNEKPIYRKRLRPVKRDGAT